MNIACVCPLTAAGETRHPAGDTVELRQKLDYEQQCYRQSESNVRVRLHSLQDSVEDTIRAVEEQ